MLVVVGHDLVVAAAGAALMPAGLTRSEL